MYRALQSSFHALACTVLMRYVLFLSALTRYGTRVKDRSSVLFSIQELVRGRADEKLRLVHSSL